MTTINRGGLEFSFDLCDPDGQVTIWCQGIGHQFSDLDFALDWLLEVS